MLVMAPQARQAQAFSSVPRWVAMTMDTSWNALVAGAEAEEEVEAEAEVEVKLPKVTPHPVIASLEAIDERSVPRIRPRNRWQPSNVMPWSALEARS